MGIVELRCRLQRLEEIDRSRCCAACAAKGIKRQVPVEAGEASEPAKDAAA